MNALRELRDAADGSEDSDEDDQDADNRTPRNGYGELVRLGRFPWRGLFGRWRAEDEAAVDEALAATGSAQYAQSYVDDLSGGERQRVWISMLLAQASPVMILDEPTSALDVRHQYGTLALLERLNRETGRGVIAIIHDINLALRFATHIVALKDGKVLFSGGAELLHSEENLRTLFEAPVKLMLHPDPPVAYTGGKKQLPLDVAVGCE